MTVVRNKAVDNSSSESNVYLKSLELYNGTLSTQFDKTKNVIYYYENNKNVDIKEAIPEIEENSVTNYKLDEGFLLVVESPNGERGIYVLIKKTKMILFFILILAILIIGLIIFFLTKKKKNKKIENIEERRKNI